jgi:hypothetical protein
MKMAENDRSVEHFFLGVIIAVVLFLVIRKEFGKFSASRGGGGGTASVDNGGGGGGGCGCSGGAGAALPKNPGVTPGAQSLSDLLSFPASTISHGAQFTEAAS